MEKLQTNFLYFSDECFNIWILERQIKETGGLAFKIANIIKKAHESKITGIYHAVNTKLQIPFLLTTSFDKSVKIWNLSGAPSLSGFCKGQKKITEALITPDGRQAIFADKFGDVFTLSTEDLSAQNLELKGELALGNLSSVNCLNLVTHEEKSYLLVSDEYHRTKVCAFPDVYKIENVHLPHFACVKQMQEYKDFIVVLYKFVDNYYQIYLMMKNKLLADRDAIKNLNVLDVNDKDVKKVKILRCSENLLVVLKIKESPVVEIFKLELDGSAVKVKEHPLKKLSNANKLYLLKSSDNLKDIVVVEVLEEAHRMETEQELETCVGTEILASADGSYRLTPGINIHVFSL